MLLFFAFKCIIIPCFSFFGRCLFFSSNYQKKKEIRFLMLLFLYCFLLIYIPTRVMLLEQTRVVTHQSFS
jgi:hypothetical protein